MRDGQARSTWAVVHPPVLGVRERAGLEPGCSWETRRDDAPRRDDRLRPGNDRAAGSDNPRGPMASGARRQGSRVMSTSATDMVKHEQSIHALKDVFAQAARFSLFAGGLQDGGRGQRLD